MRSRSRSIYSGAPLSAPVPDELHEEQLGSRRVYDGRIVNLRVDTQRMASGRDVEREVVEHRPAVVMLALRDDGTIAFVRQWRTPVARPLLELPAGGVDEGESPEEAAGRELQEEVGLRPGTLRRVHGFYVAPGWADEYLHGYIVRDCVESTLPADNDEAVSVEWHTLGEAMRLIEEREIEDAKSIVLIQALALEAVGPLGRKVIHHYRGE